MPNGLLMNEIDCDKTVRKYLIKESKIGQNSITSNIKDQICIKFILNSFKLTVMNKLLEFSPKIDGTNSTNKCLYEFIEICEHILAKTCSTLTSFKRIFNLNSYLSPSVSAIMKSFLKSVDDDDSVLINNSRLNEKSKKILKNNLFEQSPNNLNNTKNIDLNSENSKSTISLSNSNNQFNIKEFSIVLERLDDSILSKYNIKPKDYSENIPDNISNEVSSDIEHDGMVHPLDLFEESCSDKEENTRISRDCAVKTKKKVNFNLCVYII